MRVRLVLQDGELYAEPLLGKSRLIHTMVKADGLICIPAAVEGLDKGDAVAVELF